VLEPEVIEAIEQHRFAPLRSFYWRNRALNFGSIELLIESLEAPPTLPFLFRKGDALDHQALVALAARKEVRAAVQGAADVRLLWAVASIPDFRQSLHESHYDLLAGVYMALASHGVLAKDTVARAIQQLDRLDGDLDTLMTRLAYIRTWTYITNRSDWTDTPVEWQTRAHVIEDKLSDCLHQRLSERFVDKRAAHLSRKLKETKNLIASVKDDGTVLVEGEEVGLLTGFVFNPMLADGEEKAPILAAARRGLPDEIERRVQAFVASADAAFRLDDKAVIWWREAAVAQLAKGDSLYVPRAELAASDLISIDQTQRMQARLVNFLAAHLEAVLGRLTILATPDLASQTPPKTSPSKDSSPKDAPVQDTATNEVPAADSAADSADSAAQMPADWDQPVDDAVTAPVVDAATATADQPVAPAALSGAAKGIAYIIFERLGSVPTADIAHLSRNMRETDKPLLARLGLRFGVETVYMPEMLKPAQISLRSLLWSLHDGAFFEGAPPPAGRVAIDSIDDVPDLYWLAIGYRRLGQRVMRVDMVERVAMLVRTAARAGPFKITEEMLSLAGATREAMGMILLDLGCKLVSEEAAEDPAKPVIQIFEKQRKTRAAHNKPQVKTAPRADAGAAAKPHGQSRRSKASGAGTRRRPHTVSKSADKPNPDSPFAVLAGLKLKG
jgi:ATP-dependent RNA helicase SUPV3L1/SUV3